MMAAVLLRNLHRLAAGRAAEEDLNLTVESEDLADLDRARSSLVAGADRSAGARGRE
jgi:hypothetical protein